MNYQRLYAYLAGQIDDTLQMIALQLQSKAPGHRELRAVGEKLKDALLTAEEMYLDAEEES